MTVRILLVGLVLVSLAALSPASAQAPSRYPEVAAEIKALDAMKGRDLVSYTPCDPGPFDANPCQKIVRSFETWTQRNGLPQNATSGSAFKFYVLGDYDTADRYYATLVGDPVEPAAPPSGDFPRSKYPRVASEIRAFGVKDKRSLFIWPHCDPGPFDASPCEEAVRAWNTWTERNKLPQNSTAAAAFKAYVLQDYKNADRHYAVLMGHTTEAYQDVARRVQALGLRPYDGRKESCENNYFSANPCNEAVRLWKDWAAEHDLPLTYRSAGIFQAYAEGDETRGHIQFALAKGHPVPEFYEGPGNRVIELGLRPFSGRDQACENNYFAANPCPKAIRLWKQWAAQEGLELNYQSAATFQAYASHDFRTGDRLYARAKGLPDPNAYAGPGLDVVALGLQPWDPEHRNKGSAGCRHNPFSHEPCGRKSRRAFETWAAENGVPLDNASASAFEAYTNYDFDRGDRLFAAVKGLSTEELLRTYQGTPPEEDPNKLIIDIYPIN